MHVPPLPLLLCLSLWVEAARCCGGACRVGGMAIRRSRKATESFRVVPPSHCSTAAAGVAWSPPPIPDMWGRWNLSLPPLPWSKGSKGNGEPEEEVPTPIMVTDVVVNNTRLIPREVLAAASIESGLLNSTFDEEKVGQCADRLREWYSSNGYKLSKVMRAEAFSNGAVVLQVKEPVVSQHEPLAIIFLRRENASDPDSAVHVIQPHEMKRSGWRSLLPGGDSQRQCGKTRPETLVRALGLQGGEPFRLDPERLAALRSSSLFEAVSVESAREAEDGSITLEVAVIERKSVVFEPGVTKTLFDSRWAGEVTLEERNLMGRNLGLGVEARRTVDSPFTSFSLRLGSDRFGRAGAWATAVFRDVVASGRSGRDYTGQGAGSGLGGSAGVLLKSLRGSTTGRPSPPELPKNISEESGQQGIPPSEEHRGTARQGVSITSRWPILGCGVSSGGSVESLIPMEANSLAASEDVVAVWVDIHRSQMISSANTPQSPAGPCVVRGHLNLKGGAYAEGLGLARPFSLVGATLCQVLPLQGLASALNGDASVAMRQRFLRSTRNTPSHLSHDIGGQHTLRAVEEGGLGKVDAAGVFTAELRIPLLLPGTKSPIEGHVFFDLVGYTPQGSGLGGRQLQKIRQRAQLSRGGIIEDENQSDDGGEVSDPGAGMEISSGELGGGIMTRTAQGVGVTIGGMVKVDVSLTREGAGQVHIGLRDPHF